MGKRKSTARQPQASGSAATLRESIVKKALERLEWNPLKEHIDETGLSDENFAFLLGHIRRTSSLISPYPNPTREARRQQFFADLKESIRAHAGAKGVKAFRRVTTLLDEIESGYRGILGDLQKCDISMLSDAERVSACINRAVHQYVYLGEEFTKSLKGHKEITLTSGPFLTTENAVPISPDAVVASLIDSATMTIQMEAIKNGWLDSMGRVVLPALPPVTEGERYKAGSFEYLALCWRNWRRLEERYRFLGGSLKRFTAPNLPPWAPSQASEITIFQAPESEILDWVANERLNDRAVQTYMSMANETNMETEAKGIYSAVALLPAAFITPQEAHAGVSLSEILSYDIGTDTEKPAGLRFVEWLRGFCVLSKLADDRQSGTDPAGLIFTIPRSDLVSILERCGLKHEAAETFIDAVTLTKASRDLFDCPLIAMADGSFLLFGPGVLSVNPARVVLSIISQRGEALGRKGKAFERDILSFLKDQNLHAKSFTVKREGEDYEYDVVFVWGDYVFVLECKNHSLSNHHPIQAYFFGLEVASSGRQVKRLVENLKRYPEILQDHLDVDIKNKTIVPCVLNALPYSLPGPVDGVYFADASALKRFFRERYFHVSTPHRIVENVQVLHRMAVHSLWAGDLPTVEDFMCHLSEPFQIKLMLAHVEVRSQAFSAGGSHLVINHGFARKEMTLESYAMVAGASAKILRAEREEISRQVTKMRTRAGRTKVPKKLSKKLDR